MMNQAIKKVYRFYSNFYTWVFFIIFVFFIFYFLNSCSILFIKDLTTYTQTIFVGLIAFGIPFLWNAYQRILEVKNRSVGDNIDNILKREYYKNLNHDFEAFLLFPIGLAVFFGLIITPFFPPIGIIIWIVISCILFLLLPRIYNLIESKNTKSLNDFLVSQDLVNDDVLIAFSELWQKDDLTLQKEFNLNEWGLIKIFSQKIDGLVSGVDANKVGVLRDYFVNFRQFLTNRSLSTLLYADFFKNLLEWHVKIWEKEFTYLLEDDHSNDVWGQYYQLLQTLNSVFVTIEERVLSESGIEPHYFFEEFKKHIEKYKEKKIEIKKTDRLYVEGFLTDFYRVYFDKIGGSPNRYNIWEFYFPKEWRISSDNILKDEYVIQRITVGQFFHWVQGKIINGKVEDFDPSLSDVLEELFPDVDPSLWADILIFSFRLSPFDINNRVRYIIEKPKLFGLAGRMRIFERVTNQGSETVSESSFEKDFEKQRRSLDEAEKLNTLKIVSALTKISSNFYTLYNSENLERFISEAKTLQSEFKDDPEKNERLNRFLDFFTELQESLAVKT